MARGGEEGGRRTGAGVVGGWRLRTVTFGRMGSGALLYSSGTGTDKLVNQLYFNLKKFKNKLRLPPPPKWTTGHAVFASRITSKILKR